MRQQVICYAIALVIDLAQRLVHTITWRPCLRTESRSPGAEHGEQYPEPHLTYLGGCCLRWLAVVQRRVSEARVRSLLPPVLPAARITAAWSPRPYWHQTLRDIDVIEEVV
eukprot:1398261-Prymnesium_polylepis.2